ncbi:hypothetical protein ACOJR9_00380 [Alteromonas sp. A081]|uniref:hypothetical protein n=1 Tax=Alteromonas sp. A081 TaxID=3410269 RepID=UPI003B97E7F1
MAKLSQRAMNNVVIVAMLIMIALFNIDSLRPQQDTSEVRNLLPQNAYVLKIEHDDNQLVRSGQQWRQRSTEGNLSISPEAQIVGWQKARLRYLTSLKNDISEIEPLVVVVWLAGATNGRVYAFYPTPSATVVKVDNNWYALDNVSLSTLLPWI